MASRKQIIIQAVRAYLGEAESLHVADWHPGTGAVVTDLPGCPARDIRESRDGQEQDA